MLRPTAEWSRRTDVLGIDKLWRAAHSETFARLHQAGNTIVLVTHEPDVAAFAHRVVHIRDGRVEKDVHQTTPVARA